MLRDALVMDGVLVEPIKHGASRMRLSVASTDPDLRVSLGVLKLGVRGAE